MYTILFLFSQFVAVYFGYMLDRDILMFTFGALAMLDFQLIRKMFQFKKVGVVYRN